MHILHAFSATIAAALCLCSPVLAEQVSVSGATGSAPACQEKEDVASLSKSIATNDYATTLELTSNVRCWGIWDGSYGELLEVDDESGMARVSFDHLERLPEGRRGIYWLSRSFLSPR